MSDSDHAVCSLHSADSIGKTRGDKEERVERMHWALGTGHMRRKLGLTPSLLAWSANAA